MVSYGIKPCHVMGLIIGYSNGYKHARFHRKDMYNHICREKKVLTNGGDAMATLKYQKVIANNDPLFFIRHRTNNKGNLEHLFWANEVSRVNFQCFRDVLAFDSTYKVNKYNLPLVIFSRVNRHK